MHYIICIVIYALYSMQSILFEHLYSGWNSLEINILLAFLCVTCAGTNSRLQVVSKLAQSANFLLVVLKKIFFSMRL